MFYKIPFPCPLCDEEEQILDIQVSVTGGLIVHTVCCEESFVELTQEAITKFCFEQDKGANTLQ